jgi:hypothetical protein
MKRLLLAAALAISFASPAVAASQPKTVELSGSITDNRRILTIYSPSNPDDHFIGGLDNIVIKGKRIAENEGWFRVEHGFEVFARTPGGSPMVDDTGIYIPDTSNMVADHPGGLGNLKFDDVTGGLVISPGTGATLPVSGTVNASISATFNSTAPVIGNAGTSSLQVDGNGALIIATGGKTYVQLNAANTTCTLLFAVPVRVVEIDNPGIAQANPFVLYDESSAVCTGFSVFGNTHANEATGPVLGPAQYIAVGVRTTNGLTYEWFGGGVTTGSVPYLQIQ